MTQEINVKVPDIGGASHVDVIEILVKSGDIITVDTPLITLESDKASMEIPSPYSGIIDKIQVTIGDKISEGDIILTLLSDESIVDAPITTIQQEPIPEKKEESLSQTAKAEPYNVFVPDIGGAVDVDVIDLVKDDLSSASLISAGPAARRMARELGINLAEVHGSGRKSRISKKDIQDYVKSTLADKRSSQQGFALPETPIIDFSKFGQVDVKPLNKIKRLTGANLHRSWITIPHVTQFDEADITDLEEFRKSGVNFTADTGVKLTILAFVTKVVYKALVTFPQFNASLDAKGEHLIYKNYYNIGIAVETPNGLMVPVIKQVNQLSVGDIAREMAVLSKKAREKAITPNDMSGGSFTISSLGGIGGTAFTPIVNGPEVAILGLSRAMIKPVYENNDFKPRLILPLSLSYDHRVIDGAEAARFTRFIADSLSDIRRILI